MNIDRALSDIGDIRRQLKRTATLRGFRSLAAGISVVFVIAGSLAQGMIVDDPVVQTRSYLTIWLVVALASFVVVAAEMAIRGRLNSRQMVWQTHWSLIKHITPALFTGFVVTLLIADHANNCLARADSLMWALPGLWSMIYGLGLINCRTQLPRRSVYVAVYFVVVGSLVLACAYKGFRDDAGILMIASFGIGQALLGITLFWNLEKSFVTEE